MKQEDTKQKILEKSLELFSKRGYSSVTVEDIAAAVGGRAAVCFRCCSFPLIACPTRLMFTAGGGSSAGRGWVAIFGRLIIICLANIVS